MSYNDDEDGQTQRKIDKFANVSSTGLVIRSNQHRRLGEQYSGAASIASLRKLNSSANKLEFGDKVDTSASTAALIRKSAHTASQSSTLSKFDAKSDVTTYYQPQNKENEFVYLALLDLLNTTISGLAHDVLVSLLDDLIIIMKNDVMDKPDVVERNVKSLIHHCSNMLITLDNDQYNKLFTLVGRISDYIPVSAQNTSPNANRNGAQNQQSDEVLGWLDHPDISSSDSDHDDKNDDNIDHTLMNDAEAESDEYDDDDDADRRRRNVLKKGMNRGLGSDDDENDHGGDTELLADISYDRDTTGYSDLVEPDLNSNARDTDSDLNSLAEGQISVLTVTHAWLQQEVQKHLEEELSPDGLNAFCEHVLKYLEDNSENDLNEHFNFSQDEFVSFLLLNRLKILAGMKLSKVKTDKERRVIIDELIQHDPAYQSVLAPFIQQQSLSASHTGLHIHGSAATSIGNSNHNNSTNMSDIDASSTNSAQPQTSPHHIAPPPPSADLWRKNLQILDIDALAYQTEQNAKHNKPELHLPSDTKQLVHPTHLELIVPAAKQSDDKLNQIELIQIPSLPKRAQLFFPGVTSLNRIQSAIYQCALKSSHNMLVCAPTGAGKTNCAMLTISREILQALTENSLQTTQIVYIAPMKALVREVVANIQSRFTDFNKWLESQAHLMEFGRNSGGDSAYLDIDPSIDPRSFPPHGIQVQELSGDVQVTAETLSNAQILVSTPEKWDILTRKENIKSLYKNVKLVIIDEIHLLQDSRGPILESIVSRGLHFCGQNRHFIRFVGLSATLANYHDVAKFLRVDPSHGLFFFDSSFRPCPLQMNYVAIQNNSNSFGGFNLPSAISRASATAGLKGYKFDLLLNQICFQKFVQYAPSGPVLVFVHSRRDTLTTAKFLLSQAQAYKGDVKTFLSDPALLAQLTSSMSGDDADIDLLTNVILKSNPINLTTEELSAIQSRLDNPHLKSLIQFGFGIHHGGLSRGDREIIEDLYAQRKLHTLVTTATLAWGVNLPAHTVIIKGTSIYSPEKGQMIPISTQDVIQMLGRAGRPQYDSCGDGVIISSQDDVELYISAISSQLPIESQLLSRLCDLLNAEIVNGNISTFDDAITWFNYTYFSTRLKKNPLHYNIQAFYGTNDLPTIARRDPTLRQYITSLIYSSLLKLSEHNLIHFNLTTKLITPTLDGMIASKYYITYETLALYVSKLDQFMTDSSLLHLFSLSKEFKYLTTRNEEKVELEMLLYHVPIVINESIEQVSCKVNILLQAYISRFMLKGMNISTDMVFISQNAARLMWCLYELLIARKYSTAALTALQLALSIQHRVWPAQCPLRQFIPAAWSPRPFTHQSKQPLSQSPLQLANPNLSPYQLQEYESQYNLLNTVSTMLENTEIDWFNLLSSSEQSIYDITKLQASYNFIHNLPHIWVSGAIQPLSGSELKLKLKIITDFDWITKPDKFFKTSTKDVLQPCTIPFNLLHFSCHIYSSQQTQQALCIYPFTINRTQYLNNKDTILSITLPLTTPTPSVFYIHITSTQYLHCTASTALPLSNLVIPPTLRRFTQLPTSRPPVQIKQMFNSSRSFLSYYSQTYPGQTAFSPILSTIAEHLLASLTRFGTPQNKNLIFASTFDKRNFVQFYDLIFLTILLRTRLARTIKLQQQQQQQQQQQEKGGQNENDNDEDEIAFGKAWIILPTQSQVATLTQHWKETQLFTKYLVQQVVDEDDEGDEEKQPRFEPVLNLYTLSTDYIGDSQNDIRHCNSDHIVIGTVEQFTRLVRVPIVLDKIVPQLNFIVYNDLHMLSQSLSISGYLCTPATSVSSPSSTNTSATSFTSLYESLIIKIKHTIKSKNLTNNIKVVAFASPIMNSHNLGSFIDNCEVLTPNAHTNSNTEVHHSIYSYDTLLTQYPRNINVIGLLNNTTHQDLIQSSLGQRNHTRSYSSQNTLLSPSITNAYLSFLQNSALIHRLCTYCATGQALIWSSSNDTAFIIASYIANMLPKYAKMINNNRYTALFNFIREYKISPPINTNTTTMGDSISIESSSTKPTHHNPLLTDFFAGKYNTSQDHSKDGIAYDNDDADNDDDSALTTFIHCSDEELGEYLGLLSESNLEFAIVGIGVIYAGIDPKEEEALYELYQRGFITLLIANTELCYQLPISLSANFVAIMDVNYYNNQIYQYEQFSIGQLLTLSRYADTRTAHNTIKVSNNNTSQDLEPLYFTQKSQVVYFTGIGQAEMLRNQLNTPISIESCICTGYPAHLDEDDAQSIPERERSTEHRVKTGHIVSNNLVQALVADIAYGTVTTYKSAMEYLSQTLYRLRFQINPHYYNLASTTEAYLRDFLTNLTRSNISELKNLQCISVQGEDGMDDDDDDEEHQLHQKFVIRRPGLIMTSYILTPATIAIIVETLSEHATTLKFYDILLLLSSLPDIYNTISIPPYYHPILYDIGNKYQLFKQQQSQQRAQQAHDDQTEVSSASQLTPPALTLTLLLCYFSRLPLLPLLSLQLTNLLYKAHFILHALLDLSISLSLLPLTNLIIRFTQYLTYAVLPAQLYLEHANQVVSSINPLSIHPTAPVTPEPGFFLPPALISLVLTKFNSNPRQQLTIFHALSHLLQIPHFTPQFILYILTKFSTPDDPINDASQLFSHDMFPKIMSSPHALEPSFNLLFNNLTKSDTTPAPLEPAPFPKQQKLAVQRWVKNFPSIDTDLPDDDEDDESNPIRHKSVVQQHPTKPGAYRVQLKLSIPRYTDEDVYTSNQYTLGAIPAPSASAALSTIPFKRRENWYLIIVDPATGKSLVIERLKINHEEDSEGFVAASTFDLPKTTAQGKQHPLSVQIHCDAFLGSQFILDPQSSNNPVILTLPDKL